MAVAAGLAAGAAALSGVALGMSCNVQAKRSPTRISKQENDMNESASRARGSKQRAADEAEPPVGWQGFSMEEARMHTDEKQSMVMKKTPGEVLAEIQRGNARFWTNSASRPEKSAFERRGLISKQFPSVAVLGCSDSRVPTEIVFDQGLGDLFVIRVAGNALDTATLASLQYAIHHLMVKVVMVLGHEACGAVKAAQLPTDKLEQEPSELEQALKGIKAGLDSNNLQHIQDSRAHDREAVTTNVKRQVERLTRDKGIMGKVRQQELMVVGAFYEISSGIVDFFHEVSGPAPSPTGEASAARKKDNSSGRSFNRMPSHGVKSRFEPEEAK
mmetsp:Transcript_83153/g.209606  ORF Transcript_83153/g.209606 Transcript_83153/m.209606 type:complete len:330 (+) Transcript_83153:99-1088(+)|eukprot:CAMPEP_0115214402 /NCGR_PEP_ID=MMETSP0270-20121206/24288_1 /TAXON_ID=71861 /ORGANISM="Scrippsiella trochoidea, Strain CCMP3099" /LENGTH=329 /DNA_ID=CAMNT_0002628175 /DNA_START=303 /DNA_END=1292 /DNA_ORIENTATION=-